jgi:fluoroacetyl-CoA thioesterase
MTSAPAATPLPIGLRHTESMLVMPRHTVPELGQGWTGFSDMPPVFATAMMIGFIEQTCIQGLRPYLTNAQRTVGTHVDVSHISATPVGRIVTASIELTEVAGRALHFHVSCSDDHGLIGEGKHERAIIDLERFMQKMAQR